MSIEADRDTERHELARQSWQALYGLFLNGEGQRRFMDACASCGLPPGAVKALMQVVDHGQSSMRELADSFHCDPSYVTSLVDALEQAGLVERRLHPTDRRVKVVAVTPAGLEMREDVEQRLSEPLPSMDVLDNDELRLLRDLLLKVHHASLAAPGER
ncbi:MAG: MarR family winged helix-turn-helix transcriptional regulator [Acidimicrobiales bacterium]